MATPILFLVISFVLMTSLLSSSSLTQNSLSQGSSLSAEESDQVLISGNNLFTAGFYSVGVNAYCFAIWFSEPLKDGNHTIVWMANRDKPVNGRLSKLSLLKNGNLILKDANQFSVWETGTESIYPMQLVMYDTGNLVLRTSNEGKNIWESFDSPTDTLLPNQPLTRNTALVSSRSLTNFSSGFYKLFFDDDNTLRLLFDGFEVSSLYWFSPWLLSWEAGRSTYNNTRTASLNSSGYFVSTDDLKFFAADYGAAGMQRRLTLDVDGNFRLYSLDKRRRTWDVSWQAIQQPCRVHGICGTNSLCTYVPHQKPSGKRCSCLPGYKLKNSTDWSFGCESDFKLSCNQSTDDQVGFLKLENVELYGYDINFLPNYTLESCEKDCLQRCDCYGFQYQFDNEKSWYKCFLKSLLVNGHRSPDLGCSTYIKLPKSLLSSYPEPVQEFRLNCPPPASLLLHRPYKKPKQYGALQFMVWFACGLGGIEIVCVCIVWCFSYGTHRDSGANYPKGYLPVTTGFRKFTYNELKKASRNFGEEIGRGGGGIVYKGVLPDNRVAAIKRLNEANQGEAEFLAEVSTIGRVNHMNLIDIWGYCAEGKHRLLVYEYMERGSLAENLSSGALDWEKRFDIAVGSARGLAYLHEECLEWVLHCDVKPQNILLDSNYQPKVADFGLSRIINRGGGHSSSFSRVRGTRGYMAPEWIFNLPITSKVDVYSYGVVVLEMVTGKSPMITGPRASGGNSGEMEQRGLVKWVREKKNENVEKEGWVDEIIDPKMMVVNGDLSKIEMLVGVALQCVEEDKDARPSMSQVTQMLLHP